MTKSELDLLKPAAPGMDEPLEILEACHGRIEHQLQTLGRLLAHLPRAGADNQAADAARGILRYFDLAGPHHHADEEQDLFPCLRQVAAHDTALQALIDRLLVQHQGLESAWAELRGQLVAVVEGQANALQKVTVEMFSRRYRDHIALENCTLLPEAWRYLDAAAEEKLSAAMVARRQTP